MARPPETGSCPSGQAPAGLDASRCDPARFAKLFDTPHGQFLAYKDTNEDGEAIIRVIGAAVRGVVPSAGLAYDEDEKRDDAFDRLDEQMAAGQAESFYDLAAKFSKEQPK